jgi:alkylation response protein AidB-like acyl-CoA dehydrogenase
MDFRFSDDQRLFQSTVRDVLAKECAPSAVRAAWASDDGLVPGLWGKLTELGVLALLAAEGDGGLGLAMTDLVLVLEEAGRAAVPGPLLETAAAVAPIRPDVTMGTVWFATERYAVAADVADALIEVRPDEIRTWPRGKFVVTEQPGADRGRRLFAVAPSGQPNVQRANGREVFDRAALGAAAHLLGLADAMITMTADYAREREQFGKPIGSFQAVKHHLANALLRLEFARPAVYRAAHTVATNGRDRGRDVSMAKVFASDAATLAARVALQVHGAIGYTWEHDLHLWMKPAWQLAAMYGDAAWHRARVARSIGVTKGE